LDGGIVILDSFNLMPSDCVITTDEKPKRNQYYNSFMCRVFLYLIGALEANMRNIFDKSLHIKLAYAANTLGYPLILMKIFLKVQK